MYSPQFWDIWPAIFEYAKLSEVVYILYIWGLLRLYTTTSPVNIVFGFGAILLDIALDDAIILDILYNMQNIIY